MLLACYIITWIAVKHGCWYVFPHIGILFWKITLPMPTHVLFKIWKMTSKLKLFYHEKCWNFFAAIAPCTPFSDFCSTVPILVVCLKTSAYCKQHWLCSKENWTHTSIPLWLWVLWWCSSSRFVLSQYGPRTNFTHKHFLPHCRKNSTSILLIKELLVGEK